MKNTEIQNDIVVIEDKVIKDVMIDHPNIYDMLDFNEYTIKDRLEKNPYWYHQYRILYLESLHKLKRIEILKDEYIGTLYSELKYGDLKMTKVEIEKYMIPKDKEAIKFEKLYMIQKIRCETFEAIFKSFEKQGFNMSTYVKNLQL